MSRKRKEKPIEIDRMQPPVDILMRAAALMVKSSGSVGEIYASLYNAWIAGYIAASHK